MIDERTARSMADLMNVNTMGVLGIIDLAIKKGFSIDKKKVIDRLKDSGFRISFLVQGQTCLLQFVYLIRGN